MLALFLGAFSVSFAAALTPGPVVAVTLAKSYRCAWAGFQVALGSAVVEIPIIIAVYYGLGRLLINDIVQIALGLASGFLLLIFSVLLFRKRLKVITQGQDLPVTAFKLGVITSVVNPGMLIWWATVGALFISSATEYGIIGLASITLAIELPNFIWYSSISVLFNRYHSLWNYNIHTMLVIIFSFVIAGFGIWFIVDAIQALSG